MSILNPALTQALHQGMVIPAHPLVLDQRLNIDEKRQKLLTQYYIASGAGGVAVGVHTTQFAIRDPQINLLDPVLRLAAEEVADHASNSFIKVAGICGPTDQALHEATLAQKYGYHLGLISNGGLSHLTEHQLIKRTEKIGELIPVFGFYLQPAVGGRALSYDFWRDFADLPCVHAIKIAAFNRYQTLDVVRAVCTSARRHDIALYTGNDDNIVADLLTPYRFEIDGAIIEKRMVGGLLGHWAVWTQKAVELLEEIKKCIADHYHGIENLLAKGIEITDMNATIFDSKNAFEGCIPGIHTILQKQGLMESIQTLDPQETLSEGQSTEIDRIILSYPHLMDDGFVKSFLQKSIAEKI